MATDTLVKRVSALERSVAALNSRMVDPDCIMTEEDYESLLLHRAEKRAGSLVAHDIVKIDKRPRVNCRNHCQ